MEVVFSGQTPYYSSITMVMLAPQLSNLHGRISLVVKATHYTRAYGTRAILGLDNS